jgi:hypothetical protein
LASIGIGISEHAWAPGYSRDHHRPRFGVHPKLVNVEIVEPQRHDRS